MHRSVKTHTNTVIPAKRGVAKSIKALNPRGTKATNVHGDGLSLSVMKALATESRRHRGKAFFSSPCASVAIFFHGKGKALLCALCALCGSLLFRAFCDNLLRGDDGCMGGGIRSQWRLPDCWIFLSGRKNYRGILDSRQNNFIIRCRWLLTGFLCQLLFPDSSVGRANDC